MFRFEKFDVWQQAIQFAELVYEATAGRFRPTSGLG